jgi:hypothetical protein
MSDDSVYSLPLLAGYPEDAIRIPDHSGEPYVAVLERLHRELSPKTYLEIGAQNGQSLALARCPSIAIDPDFRIASNVFPGKRSCHLFQMSSDDFFANYDPTKVLNGRLDFAFLDGMHWFEFLLRDFINTERHANPNSIIALHDCVPLDTYSVRRNIHDTANQEISRHPEWWAGDVWKTLYILRRYRPDLKIYVFDAPPTGLVLITCLDPNSNFLQQNYFHIVEESVEMNLADIGVSEFAQSVSIRSTLSLSSRSDIHKLFWL